MLGTDKNGRAKNAGLEKPGRRLLKNAGWGCSNVRC